MLRRGLLMGVLICALIAISKARTKRAAEGGAAQDAKTNWDDEGGTPAPDPVDTPAPC
jgi:hypothetical protein